MAFSLLGAELKKAQAVFLPAHKAVADKGCAYAAFGKLKGSDELWHLDFYARHDFCFLKHLQRARAEVDMRINTDKADICELMQVNCRAFALQMLALGNLFGAEALLEQLGGQAEVFGNGEQDVIRKGWIMLEGFHNLFIAAEGEI